MREKGTFIPIRRHGKRPACPRIGVGATVLNSLACHIRLAIVISSIPRTVPSKPQLGRKAQQEILGDKLLPAPAVHERRVHVFAS